MRFLAALALVGFLSTPAAADLRYRLRPRLGEVVKLDESIPECADQDMHDRLWRTLFRIPTVTVHQDGTLDIDLAAKQSTLRADEQLTYTTGKVVAYWDSSTAGIFFGVSIKERPNLPPRIEVVVVRQTLAEVCAVKWVGLGDKY